MKEISNTEIFEMLNSEEFNSLANYYEHPTFLDILGVSRKEFAHSNFLCWLFTPKNNHGLGDYAIRKLLELCYNHLSDEMKNIIAKCNYNISDVKISREVRIDDGTGIMDLFINLYITTATGVIKTLHIIIENKIESSENQDQTLKYQQWYENNYSKDEEALMLYFTPRPEEEISSSRFIKISYTDLSNKVMKYCLATATSDNTKFLISDYICCLSQPLVNQTEDGKEETIHSVLAVNKSEKEKVHQLLEKYQTEILYIIDGLIDRNDNFITDIYKSRFITFKGIFTIVLSETVSNELSEKLNKILDNRVKKIEFNNKVYLLYGRKRNSIGYLVRDMIEMYAKETGVSLNDLKEKLSLKVWLNPWGDVIITNNTPERPDQFYMKEEEKVKLSDDTVYVARYWTTDDALEIAKLLGQEIKVLA